MYPDPQPKQLEKKAAAADAGAEKRARKIIPFTDLAHCGEQVWIEYRGKLYRLQSTRQGKLILTK